MGENSAIEWCDMTFNPWIGCQKVGPGCDHCYAEARDIRLEGGKHWGPHAPRRRTSPTNWAQVRRWNRKAQAFRAMHGHWPRVFCASLADIGDTAVDRAWHRDFWELVRECRDLRFILLTKRIGNLPGLLPFGWLDGDFDHVGVMITVVDQPEADRDVKKLVNLPMSGRQWRGISHEPALGGIDWSAWIAHLDWIIYGGESGPDARPHHPDWARADRDQCAAAGVAFMMKQWGEWAPGECGQGGPTRTEEAATFWDGEWLRERIAPRQSREMHRDDEPDVYRLGKAAAGRLLDGREHLAFPEALR